MSTEENMTTNRRFYEEVINQQHLAVVDEVAGEEYVSHSFPPGLPPGREGLKAFISAFHAAFPNGHLSIDQMIAEGDTVATRLTFRGTHTGDFLGIPATGKQVVVVLAIWDIRSEKSETCAKISRMGKPPQGYTGYLGYLF